METVYLDAPDERDPCHLLVAHRTVLGAWLQAPLTSAVGLLMDDVVLVAMVVANVSTMHTSAITVGRCEPADITRPQVVLPLSTN